MITLVTDTSDTDQYGRLLRYIYVGDTLINEALIRDGWAEVVRFPPDTRYYDRFRDLEQQGFSSDLDSGEQHPDGRSRRQHERKDDESSRVRSGHVGRLV